MSEPPWFLTERSGKMSFTVELDEKTAAVVQELAAEEKRSASEVVRDALTRYARRGKRALPKGAGKYRSGRSDTAEKAEEILRDAVKEGKWP
jgi:predicted transcriptional regulator